MAAAAFGFRVKRSPKAFVRFRQTLELITTFGVSCGISTRATKHAPTDVKKTTFAETEPKRRHEPRPQNLLPLASTPRRPPPGHKSPSSLLRTYPININRQQSHPARGRDVTGSHVYEIGLTSVGDKTGH